MSYKEAKFKAGDTVIYTGKDLFAEYQGESCYIFCSSSHIDQKNDICEHKYDIKFADGIRSYGIPEENLSYYIENGDNVIKIADEAFFPWTCHFKFKKGDLVYIKGNDIVGTIDKFYSIQKSYNTYEICTNYVGIKIDGIPGIRFLVTTDQIKSEIDQIRSRYE